MDIQTIPVRPERLAQPEQYAQRQGKDTAAALDELLGDYLAAEEREYDDAVHDVLEAYEEMKAGPTIPADQVLEELRVKHGFPR